MITSSAALALIFSLIPAIPYATAQTTASLAYTPNGASCPNVTQFIRLAGSESQRLSPQELSYISARTNGTGASAWQTYLQNVQNAAQEQNVTLPAYMTALLSGGASGTALPNVGLAVSGGGPRAATFNAAVLDALDARNPSAAGLGTGGLLQAANYLVGSSGGSWLVGSLSQAGFPTLPELVFGSGNASLTGAASASSSTVSLADIWARVLARHFVNGTDATNSTQQAHGAGQLWSELTSVSSFHANAQPFPIIVMHSISSQGGNSNSSTTLPIPLTSVTYEFNPFEFGSYDPNLAAFIPTRLLGSTASGGSGTGGQGGNCTADGEPETGTNGANGNCTTDGQPGNGTSSTDGDPDGQPENGTSATDGNCTTDGQPGNGTSSTDGDPDGQPENGTSTTDGNCTTDGQPGNGTSSTDGDPDGQPENGTSTTDGNCTTDGKPETGTNLSGQLSSSLLGPAIPLLNASRDFLLGHVPNTFQGIANATFPDAQSDVLTLVDGSENAEFVPFQPLLVKARNVDVIFASDASGKTDTNYSNGSSIITAATRAASLSGSYSFPPVPSSTDQFIAAQLNQRPVFFGCNSADNATNTPIPPLVICLPNPNEIALTNTGTSQDASALAIIDQAYTIATRGSVGSASAHQAEAATPNLAGDSLWPVCLACAVTDRARARQGLPRDGVCAACFQQYCFS
ncbi:lysophospholipase-like protein [Phanerochaete sordida]|uniref:Lysophospholipase n=1 Tax=Phanerochaete sordida TaxID=48140 RepID=A0A9P3L9L9_9APHY|nr:lysophospholipase-like protein [Phanerochaete sordida]